MADNKILFQVLNLMSEEIKKTTDNIKSEEKRYYDFFISHYRNEVIYRNNNEQIVFKKTDFPEIIKDLLKYLDKQLTFINKIIKTFECADPMINEHLNDLLNALTYRLEQELMGQINQERIIFQFLHFADYSLEFQSIILLSSFIKTDSNIVLIGANGSGKSTFANILKGTDEEYISVIPAQKSLYYSVNDAQILSSRINDLQRLLLENNIKKSKEKDHYNYHSYQNNQFTKLIVAMKEDHFLYLIRKENEVSKDGSDESVYKNFKYIFQLIFPDIEVDFKENSSDEILKFIKNGVSFHINSLSEGEKAVIYYAISVLMATNNSLIVVDEPETYLNPSLANTLWDNLIKVREDCQFLFITHSVDFVSARNDAETYWIKEHEYPSSWEIEKIDDNFALPKALLTEVLGSKNPILFCEGDSKNSKDYEVYQSLLSNKYTVIPVGGHRQVIDYCKVFSTSEWFDNECIGIIDGDNFSNDKVLELRENNIIVLPFNEIEMFLVSEEVMKYTLKDNFYEETEQRISDFKNKFWERFQQEKETIALIKVKVNTEEFIQSRGIENYKTIDLLEENVEKISSYPVKQKYQHYIDELDDIFNNRNYNELLKVCNLKYQISREIANVTLDSNYETKAINNIKFNEELRQLLLEKYFKAARY